MPSKKTIGLDQLLVQELQDLYDAEKQLTRALPKVAKAANDEELGEAIREHLEVTKGHVDRMEQVFESLGMNAKSKPCAGMKGIVSEASENLQALQDSAAGVADIGIIGDARRVEHYEIAGYTSCIEMARQIGHEDVAGLLAETLQEEQEADEKLAEIGRRVLEEAHLAEQSSGEEESAMTASAQGRTNAPSRGRSGGRGPSRGRTRSAR